MILALPLPPIRGWDQCLACGKLTYLLQAHTSSHVSERGHCSVGVTPLSQCRSNTAETGSWFWPVLVI